MQDLLDPNKLGFKTIEPVPFSDRLFAFIMDFLILFAVIIILIILNVFFMALPSLQLVLVIVGLLLVFAYYIYEAFTGRTPGKIYYKIQVGNVDGTVASTGRLFVRFLIKFSGSITSVLITMIGLKEYSFAGGILSIMLFLGCFLALTRKRQTLHDLLAGTAVFNSKDLIAKS